MSNGICGTCTKLWREYADTIEAYLETVRLSHADAAREDGAGLMKSEWLERASVRNRKKARKALTEHQVTHLIKELETHQGDSETA